MGKKIKIKYQALKLQNNILGKRHFKGKIIEYKALYGEHFYKSYLYYVWEKK